MRSSWPRPSPSTNPRAPNTRPVVIPILTQHYVLLQRNLLYTAVTRGKKLVVMVGSKRALAIGIGNEKTRKRYTYLRNRLSL
jgi:exodeoxyribonuclease V alpha subunit